MKWTPEKSIKLTQIVIIIAALCCLVATFAAPMLKTWVPYLTVKNFDLLTISIQVSCVIAIVCLILLYRLVRNIDNVKTFSDTNIRILRQLSWLCFLVSIILIVSSFNYIPLIALAAGTAFIGLILRVIKNVFCQAKVLKEENDYTI